MLGVVNFFRRRGRLLALWWALLALPGCALLPWNQPPAEEKAPAGRSADTGQAATAQAGAGEAGGQPAAASAFDVRVECADDELRALVERHNDLQRYRRIADLDDAEFARLMVLAEHDVRNLLATEGHFNPQVRLHRRPGNGRPLLVIAIEPGPPTTVASVAIDFEGDIAPGADPADAAQREAIVADWGLPEGRRFTQARWADAKTDALRALVARRYPRGRISYSLADVSAAEARARPAVPPGSGPRAGQRALPARAGRAPVLAAPGRPL